MKRVFKIVLPIVILLSAIVFIPWAIVWAWITPLPETMQEQTDDALRYGLDGIIVYVDQAGKSPAFYSAGYKNKANKIPADPHTLFKIASISKLYLAAATAKLVNSKRLSLNDTLAKLLPEVAGRIANADKITLRMLLQHRSGIADWIEDPQFPWGKPPGSVNEVLELVIDDPSQFEPDRRYDYSNTNYLLIGIILDKKLGYDHQQYIKKEILSPLGLIHTFGSLDAADSSAVSSGYDSHYDQDVKRLDFVSPGGSMVATAQDVGIFLRALNDGSLLTEEEQAIYSSIYEYDHTGLLPGYQSIAKYHRDIDTVVVLFVNTSGGNAWTITDIVYNRIVRIVSR